MLSNLSDDFKLSLQNIYVPVSVCVCICCGMWRPINDGTVTVILADDHMH